MSEIDEAASIIQKTVDPDADIIFGAVIDDKMVDQIKITLIATKFDESRLKMFGYQSARRDDIFGKSVEPARPAQKDREAMPEPEMEEEDDFDIFVKKQEPEKKPQKQEPKQNDPFAGLDEFDEDASFAGDDDGFDIPAFLRKK